MASDFPASPPPWPKQRHAKSFVFPLLLVVVGVVLLLNNLGILPWSIWVALGQLWPVILILFGLDLVLGRRHAWLGIVVATIMLLALVGVASWRSRPTLGTQSASPTAAQAANIPLDDTTNGQIVLNFGVGRLTVGALPPAHPDLVQATALLPPGLQLQQTVGKKIGQTNVTLSAGRNGPLPPFPPFGSTGRDPNLEFDALLAQHVPLMVQINVGAGDADIDLTNLTVSHLTLNEGAGSATIHFPSGAGQTSADIHGGAGQFTLIIPSGVGASIHNQGGLVNLKVPSDRFQQVSDGYETIDDQSAPRRLDITLHAGIGEVDVQ